MFAASTDNMRPILYVCYGYEHMIFALEEKKRDQQNQKEIHKYNNVESVNEWTETTAVNFYICKTKGNAGQLSKCSQSCLLHVCAW